jgi:hypothetical protein
MLSKKKTLENYSNCQVIFMVKNNKYQQFFCCLGNFTKKYYKKKFLSPMMNKKKNLAKVFQLQSHFHSQILAGYE